MSIKSPDFPPYLFCKKGKPKNFLYQREKEKIGKETFFTLMIKPVGARCVRPPISDLQQQEGSIVDPSCYVVWFHKFCRQFLHRKKLPRMGSRSSFWEQQRHFASLFSTKKPLSVGVKWNSSPSCKFNFVRNSMGIRIRPKESIFLRYKFSPPLFCIVTHMHYKCNAYFEMKYA